MNLLPALLSFPRLYLFHHVSTTMCQREFFLTCSRSQLKAIRLGRFGRKRVATLMYNTLSRELHFCESLIRAMILFLAGLISFRQQTYTRERKTIASGDTRKKAGRRTTREGKQLADATVRLSEIWMHRRRAMKYDLHSVYFMFY